MHGSGEETADKIFYSLHAKEFWKKGFTIFEFSQVEEMVTAQYSGGGIVNGYLIGKLNGSELEFRYVQLQKNGTLDGGNSNCEAKILNEGRLQIVEHFKWESRACTGANIFEEIKVSL